MVPTFVMSWRALIPHWHGSCRCSISILLPKRIGSIEELKSSMNMILEPHGLKKKKSCSGEIQKSVYFNIFIHTDLYYMRLPKWDPQIIKMWQQALWDLQWLLKKPLLTSVTAETLALRRLTADGRKSLKSKKSTTSQLWKTGVLMEKVQRCEKLPDTRQVERGERPPKTFTHMKLLHVITRDTDSRTCV